MKCLGVKDNHRLYYDEKHNEYLLLTPNFRFTRMIGHCNNETVKEWAYKLRDKHKEKNAISWDIQTEPIEIPGMPIKTTLSPEELENLAILFND